MQKIQVCNFEPELCEIDVADLTRIQKEYVEIIEGYKLTNKRIPSIREIGKLMGCSSPSSIHDMMAKLKSKGYDYKRINYDRRGLCD